MLRQETTELGEKSAHPGVTESTNTDATRTLEKEMLAPEDASGRSWRQRVGKVEPYQLVFIYPLSLQLQTSLEKASVVILESAGMRGILGGLASAGYSPKVEASASWGVYVGAALLTQKTLPLRQRTEQHILSEKPFPVWFYSKAVRLCVLVHAVASHWPLGSAQKS